MNTAATVLPLSLNLGPEACVTLAKALLLTSRIREASYNKQGGSYGKGLFAACEEAIGDSNIKPLVIALVINGASENFQWAASMIDAHGSHKDNAAFWPEVVAYRAEKDRRRTAALAVA